jgi:hypothetical protein
MTNPTSNFNWQMPTNTDLVYQLPADFEVFGQAVDTSLADLKGGTTDQVLAKNSNTDMDFKWVTSGSFPWQTWTATYGNITVGNGTATARYQQIGKTINFRYNLTFGSTTSITGNAHFFLPVTPLYDTPCSIVVRDDGVAFYPMTGLVFASGGYCDIVVGNASGTYVTQSQVTAAVPVALATGDNIYVSGTYEVA